MLAAKEAAIVVHLMCCVDLQVYFPEHTRGRIDLFDLLSDVRPADHVGCRSAPSQSSTCPKSSSFVSDEPRWVHEVSRHD